MNGVYEQAAADWPAGKPALAVLDTCYHDFRSHRACRGLGRIGTGGKGRGLCSQAALLLSEGGQPQGLLGLWNWTRGADSGLPWPAAGKNCSRPPGRCVKARPWPSPNPNRLKA